MHSNSKFYDYDKLTQISDPSKLDCIISAFKSIYLCTNENKIKHVIRRGVTKLKVLLIEVQ